MLIRLGLLLAGYLVPASSATAQLLDGVWRSQGYGYVFEIQGPALKAFEVTTRTCVPGFTAKRDAGLIPDREATFRTADGDVYFVRTGGPSDHKLLHNDDASRGWEPEAADIPSVTRYTRCLDARWQKKGWMHLDDYKVVWYRNQPDGWVAEIPSIRGCYALMATREEALAELERVFGMIATECSESGRPCLSTRLRSRMPGGRAEEFRRVAMRLGFERQRQIGSHERWIHPDGRAVTIPIHGGREIGPPCTTKSSSNSALAPRSSAS